MAFVLAQVSNLPAFAPRDKRFAQVGRVRVPSSVSVASALTPNTVQTLSVDPAALTTRSRASQHVRLPVRETAQERRPAGPRDEKGTLSRSLPGEAQTSATPLSSRGGLEVAGGVGLPRRTGRRVASLVRAREVADPKCRMRMCAGRRWIHVTPGGVEPPGIDGGPQPAKGGARLASIPPSLTGVVIRPPAIPEPRFASASPAAPVTITRKTSARRFTSSPGPGDGDALSHPRTWRRSCPRGFRLIPVVEIALEERLPICTSARAVAPAAFG